MARRCYCILENFQPILLFTDVVSTSLYCMKYIKLAGKLYNDGINSILYYEYKPAKLQHDTNITYLRFEVNIVWISMNCY